MTKHVVPNAQVAHLWAHQSQDSARSGNGQVSFVDGTLYSYRTPIANIVRDKNGAAVALLDSRSYSITTSAHQSNARGALGYGDNQIMDSYSVPYIGKGGGQSPEYLPEEGGQSWNVRHMVELFRGNLKSYIRARDEWRRDYEMQQATGRVETIRGYVERFALVVELPEFAAEIEAARATRAAKEAKASTPEAIAKKEKEAKARVERTRRDFREVRGIFGEDWREPWHRESRVFTPEDWAARDARLVAIQADRVAEWRAGANVTPPRFHGALLRLMGKRIQTSQGAEFPVEHGRRAFPLIARIRALGRGWKANGEQIPLGSFRINSVASNGDVTAGCHFVKWEEIESMAVQLGLIGKPEIERDEDIDNNESGDLSPDDEKLANGLGDAQ